MSAFGGTTTKTRQTVDRQDQPVDTRHQTPATEDTAETEHQYPDIDPPPPFIATSHRRTHPSEIRTVITYKLYFFSISPIINGIQKYFAKFLPMREYFESIIKVCPYSLESFDAGKVPILEFSVELIDQLYHELDSYHAVLFKCHTSIDRDSLESTAHGLADKYPDAEWFFSHPVDRGHSTPVPVLIMQNREHLLNARKEYKIFRNGKNMA